MTGFDSKRQMAADKLQDGKCKLCIDGCAAYDARAQPAQEPVGMLHIERLDKWLDASLKERKQREWVGLTNDEVNDFAAGCHLGKSVQSAIYEAEAKLKEKNS
jgi:hypothetical protein